MNCPDRYPVNDTPGDTEWERERAREARRRRQDEERADRDDYSNQEND